MWRHVGASVRGTSHADTGMECQDTSEVVVSTIGGVDALVFAVSDGAGSAKHSAIASKLIVSGFITRMLQLSSPAFSTEEAQDICGGIRGSLEVQANILQCDLKELSATLIGGIVSADGATFVQVGDGGIVYQTGEDLLPGTWPTSGEYANQTTFLTSAAYNLDLQHLTLQCPITAVSAFTDGLQDLVLVHASRSVHRGFFDPMLKTLRSTDDWEGLGEPLCAFLNSKPVIQRTDDDKTLILACRE